MRGRRASSFEGEADLSTFKLERIPTNRETVYPYDITVTAGLAGN